jgi:hypothetical protein
MHATARQWQDMEWQDVGFRCQRGANVKFILMILVRMSQPTGSIDVQQAGPFGSLPACEAASKETVKRMTPHYANGGVTFGPSVTYVEAFCAAQFTKFDDAGSDHAK